MTLGSFLTVWGLAAVLVWEFAVLAAAQLTIRLIMAFSVGETLRAALVLGVLAYPVAALYDLCTGPAPGFGTRLTWAPVAMLGMAIAGYITARWVLAIKRTPGRIAASIMIGVLAPQLFTLAPV